MATDRERLLQQAREDALIMLRGSFTESFPGSDMAAEQEEEQSSIAVFQVQQEQ